MDGSDHGFPPKIWSLIGLIAAGIVISVGTLWAMRRGANDFNVFFEAWRLVADGRGREIYAVSPDRFLYAPGFAWLFAPLSWLPRTWALALWCLAKAAVLGWMIRQFRSDLAAWALVLLARPVLIDFQYGQVNVLILGACLWALLTHFRSSSSKAATFWSWFFMAVAGLAKLFPLPLLLVPWLFRAGNSRPRLNLERRGAVAGVLFLLLLPSVTAGIRVLPELHSDWRQALMDRGRPLVSHNQSFSAVLHHYFTGAPTHVQSHGPEKTVQLGWSLLSEQTVAILSFLWFSLFSGLLLFWIVKGGARPALVWISVALGLLIVPSHLVWKPYFVFGLPAAMVLLQQGRRSWKWLIAIGITINFSGFDFVGQDLGGRFEAAGILLWTHLVLLVLVAKVQHGPAAKKCIAG